MNNSIVLVLVAVYAFACLSVNADHYGKCSKDEMMKVKKARNAMLEDESVPCANHLDLKRFQCSGGEDPEADKKTRMEYMHWGINLDEDKMKEVWDCMKQLNEAAMEKLEDEISGECKGKIEKLTKRMGEAFKEEL